MDKANAAEWLLRQVVGPVRASELVGDQLEAHPSAGRLSFWLSIARLLLVFSWRTIVGVAVSTVGGIILAILSFYFGRYWPAGPQGFLPETTVLHITLYVLGISALLWVATLFSLVQFGWRSTLTSTGLVASILFSASSCFFWSPSFAVTLAIMWLSFFIFYTTSEMRRRSLGVLLVAVAAAWLTGFALSILRPDPYSVFGKWQAFTALVLIPIVESGIAMLLHRKFIASQSTSVHGSVTARRDFLDDEQM